MVNNIKISVIGGGTGTFSVLTGLKKYTDNITAIVTMADSGGSARKERDEWGLLPSSDIRKSLIALADISSKDSLLLRKLFQYRYSEGTGIRGMSFGNLFLVALTKLLKSQKKAIVKAGDILKIRGRVLPVSFDKVDLAAKYEDGSIVVGEHFIDEPKHNGKLGIVKLWTKPQAHATEEVITAIMESQAIILGPGGFYTTILANLAVKGVVEAIQKSRAKIIFILNLMTEYGQTFHFTALKFIEELKKYMPLQNLDYIFINNSPIPEKILKKYRKVHAETVINNLYGDYPFRVISTDLLNPRLVKRQSGDTLNRSFVRHDPDKVADLCMKVLNLV